jgi:predicted kinase
VLRDRVAARRGDASDADVAVLEATAARDSGPLDWRVVDAAADPIPVARECLGVHALNPC